MNTTELTVYESKRWGKSNKFNSGSPYFVSFLYPVLRRFKYICSTQWAAVINQLSPIMEAVQVLPSIFNLTRNALPSSPSLWPGKTCENKLVLAATAYNVGLKAISTSHTYIPRLMSRRIWWLKSIFQGTLWITNSLHYLLL